METGGEGGLFTARKQLSDKNPVSPFLLGYPHMLEAEMVNCTQQANCSPYGLISFGSSVWQNAEDAVVWNCTC